MNIKEALEEFNFFNEGDYITKNMSIAKDVVLTAYEQKCNYIKENEIYKKNLFNNYEEKCKELEKEKEKNKKAKEFIDDKNNYFEDGENWQNVLKIKEILEE